MGRQIRRSWVAPGALRELKDLLYELYLEARAPTLDNIEKGIDADMYLVGCPRRDTVGRVLGASDLPAKLDDAVAVAVVLARMAKRPPNKTVEVARQVRLLWMRASTEPPLGRLITDFDDSLILNDLEVHPAVDAGAATAGLGVLPAYVPREFDVRLRELVAAAAGGRSGIGLLVGESSTGKTRACWEAVKALPGGWRLWHPIEPDYAPALVRHLDHVGPRTVVWLNEAQHYLLNQEHGAHLASGLREVLNTPERAPVLVLGTLWHQHWQGLTAVPRSGPDPYAQARQLVKAKDIPVPAAFTAEELKAVLTASDSDPRLAEALARAKQGQVTQYLAGGPALLERYYNAPDAARALIEAAMDARSLGHGEDLPRSLLEAAVPGYLTDQQWDALPVDWQQTAWDHVTDTQPCRGARSPLYRRRPRGGQPAYDQPHYRLADYLEHHGRETRPAAPPPAALWDSFVNFAARDSLMTLAAAAQDRGMMREASLCYVAAVRAGIRTAGVVTRHDAGARQPDSRGCPLVPMVR